MNFCKNVLFFLLKFINPEKFSLHAISTLREAFFHACMQPCHLSIIITNLRCFLEKVMITFRSENTIFITESDNNYFLVIITFGPSLKSNGHKMSHYSHITWSLPSKVIITCAITSHYLRGDGNR